MSEKPREADRWQMALEEKLRELRRCQETRGHTSCLSCPEVLGCEIRTRYVHAVYESMNKGTGGGFEF